MNGIYYFSGTGNSYIVARSAAEELPDSVCVAITRELVEGLNDAAPVEYEKMLVVFPAYAYGLPALVKQFLKKFTYRYQYLALTVTCGTSPGGTLASAKRILKKRKLKASFFYKIRSVENYIPLFGAQKQKKRKKRLLSQSEKTSDLLQKIQSEAHNSVFGFRPLSSTVSTVFRAATPFLAHRIQCDPKKCTSCGLCAKVCPADAIVVRDGRPEISSKYCNQCQACLNFCPTKALRMWRHGKKCKQYSHPDASAGELLKR